MSFNRRGGDRRPDRPDRPDRDRFDRPARRGGGDWQPREQRDRAPDRGGDRPYQSRPYQPRPRFDRPPDEGAMSIRLDPRRLGTLKRLAADADVRPGDLVRQWVEERIDAARGGTAPSSDGLASRVEELAARVAALEAAGGSAAGRPQPAAQPQTEPESQPVAEAEPEAEPDPVAEAATPEEPAPARPARRNAVSAPPAGERVALHDEMIAVLRERGPMTAGELAGAIAERGRYAPPRSGKPLDAAMVSQRVSNPTYRARFTRAEGRIGLAE
jgi:hypothetical protein